MLDENIARLANFTFWIGNTTPIGLVNLDTLLRQIMFYIVFVNILFLFYLADIDKYETFFNNITNQII